MQRFLYLAEGQTVATAFTIQDDNDVAVDLSGYATVQALVKKETGATAAITCAVTDATAGTVTIPWTGTSLVRGHNELSFKLAEAGGDFRLLPGRYTILLVVRPNIEV